MFKKAWRALAPNPLDQILKRAQKQGAKRVLLYWNRGLGDIALGLFAIVYRIRTFLPDAEITFVTRPNLEGGFTLLGGVKVIVLPELKRGQDIVMDTEGYDLVIERPDPTYWVKWQLGKLTPKLHWQSQWDALCERYPLKKEGRYIGAHVQTETAYATWRNWPDAHWRELFERVHRRGVEVLLFGYGNEPVFKQEGVIDLRGQTPLFELLSIIKNRCEALVVPDSGVSSMTYFLDMPFPLKIVSLWADPYMGILKQNVASPNPLLVHKPLIGPGKKIDLITPEMVERTLFD